MTSLPVDDYLPAIVAALRANRAVVVTAAPGAGKTTRVPPALVADGPVLLLQPRRVAARSIARRIAEERGWTIGREVGWHVRADRQFSPATELLVATEGILTARLQQDPLLSEFRTLVIDEFHERSIHADLGLALARQAWLARHNFRIVVMSATLDAERVSVFLGNCPVVAVPGRQFPLDIRYRPGASMEQVVPEAAGVTPGALLCFLPGAAEIRRAADALAARADTKHLAVMTLYGGLDADAQDAVLRPSAGSRVILATNIAETTLTVPDVVGVVDTGLHKVARYDAERAIDSLEIERVTTDSADQRAGRAGRTQPGVVWRLWDARDRLRPHREPDIARVDLTAPALDVLAWGGDPRTLEWFEAPQPEALAAAMALLRRLGATDAFDRLTPLGRDLRRLPLHPRLGRLLIADQGSAAAARACALLSERHFIPPRHGATPSDLLSAVDHEEALPHHIRRTARELEDGAKPFRAGVAAGGRRDDVSFRRAVLAAYPDRVARRRTSRSDRVLLSSGTGARLSRDSGVHDAEFLVAVDVTTGPASFAGDSLVRIASGIERDWLEPTSTEIRHELDAESGVVRASLVERYGAIDLSSRNAEVDPVESARLIGDELLRRGPSEETARLLKRLEFAGMAETFESLVRTAAVGQRKLDDVDVEAALGADRRRKLEKLAPAAFHAPSGRAVRLDYRDAGVVVGSTRLQDVIGLSETPRIGPGKVPVTFELLAPNGRPVQVTNDLKSFWAKTYPEIRGPLKARYPKHKWP